MTDNKLWSMPHVSFQPNSFTFYSRVINTDTGNFYVHNRHKLTRDNHTKGKISNHARRRLNKAFNWLLYLSKNKSIRCKQQNKIIKFKLNFITLTLSSTQIHSDNELKKKLLNNFLTVLRTKYDCEHYIWKAEKQKNGNLHFHIITGTYIHYKNVQKEWNRIQNVLGYVDRYTQNTGKSNPPSTEIKAVKNIRKLSIYVAKYFTKQDDNGIVDGRLWYASKALLNPPSLSLSIADIDFDKIYSYLSNKKVRSFSTDYTTTYFISIGTIINEGLQELGQYFDEMVQEHFTAKGVQSLPPPSRLYL